LRGGVSCIRLHRRDWMRDRVKTYRKMGGKGAHAGDGLYRAPASRCARGGNLKRQITRTKEAPEIKTEAPKKETRFGAFLVGH
jgi:hypothetical protein